MTGNEGVWLYAITSESLDGVSLSGVLGVAGEAVRVVHSTDLAAVVGSVDLDEFGEVPLRRHLEDLDWLAATARAHERVVSAVLRCGPTIPLRLATLYLDDDRIRSLLEVGREKFCAALRSVAGRSEWGVKGYGDARALAQTSPEKQAEPSPSGKGTAYLLRRRAELTAQQNVERRAAAEADDLHAALLQRAVDGLRRPVTDPVLSGKRAWMIFNGTYLVDDDRVDDFTTFVATLDAEREGITVELTGPWPPYSFSGIDMVTR
ncbi:gas vesicle protein GvpFL [Rhodococcus sp. AD45-ID]|uniref:GvpL/GvpF family gas vesicle protein n=1 Tax=unclassified Rhodococcus (in: high G+C Gram-positive bacteria) TaxID=192944 RepID=UPI0005D31C98|nr:MULTISPECIES: GvpL/GvpF family gas vesicle protein [unclassified Rhodococcus (in: high G+C Gram-positive bacteria)]PSR41983.1 gas vesicle protein GvpFL [Rhodococcus sp. AD45-ID]RZL26366.1 MAG: GvpL/GvpF family gas vesicle protein [Rhodococcus sp. (in: high G+C Gram-positive bacteria)]